MLAGGAAAIVDFEGAAVTAAVVTLAAGTVAAVAGRSPQEPAPNRTLPGDGGLHAKQS